MWVLCLFGLIGLAGALITLGALHLTPQEPGSQRQILQASLPGLIRFLATGWAALSLITGAAHLRYTRTWMPRAEEACLVAAEALLWTEEGGGQEEQGLRAAPEARPDADWI